MQEIKTTAELNRWVKVQLALKQTSLRQIAKQMHVSYPRLSEAINGRQPGSKYIIPIILYLGGDIEDFKSIL